MELSKLRRGLFLLGFVSSAIGVGAMLYATFIWRPKLAEVARQTHDALNAADTALVLVGQDTRVAEASLQFARAGGTFVGEMPAILKRLDGVLREGAHTSYQSGETAEETKKGVAGIVLPKKEVDKSTIALRRTAHQMRALSELVSQLQGPSQRLSKASLTLTQDLSRIEPQLVGDQGVLTRAHSALAGVDRAVDKVDLPDHIMMAAWLLAGIYIVIGAAAFAVAQAIPVSANSERTANNTLGAFVKTSQHHI